MSHERVFHDVGIGAEPLNVLHHLNPAAVGAELFVDEISDVFWNPAGRVFQHVKFVGNLPLEVPYLTSFFKVRKNRPAAIFFTAVEFETVLCDDLLRSVFISF